MTALSEVRAFLERWKDLGSLPTLDSASLIAYTDDFNRLFEVVSGFPPYASLMPQEREETVQAIRSLRVFLQGIGDLTGVRDLFEELTVWFNKGGDPVHEALALNVLSFSCCHLTMHTQAEARIMEAFERVSRRDPQHPVLAVLCSTRGINFMRWKRWHEAEAAFREAERRASRQDEGAFMPYFSVDRDTVLGSVYNNIASATLYRLSHDPPAENEISRDAAVADDCLRRAVNLYRNELFLQRSYSNLAIARIMERRFDEAARLLNALDKSIDGDPSLGMLRATVERLRGEMARRRGDAPRAIAHFRRSLEWSLRQPNPDEEEFAVNCFIEVVKMEAEAPPASQPGAAGLGLDRLRNLVEQLLPLLESKDWYTGRNHARAVASLSLRLARAAADGNGAPRYDRDMLYVGGLLHDVGKLATPWALLNKIRPIDAAEREVLERHAAKGGEIVRSAGFSEVAFIVAEHHERPDGRGYPSGKSDVSFMGAAVALADVFEAMVTPNRRWRNPKSPEEACREVELRAGDQFVASIAQALPKVIRSHVPGAEPPA